MASRLKLHEELKTLLGSSNVYFQPPESVKINYPCIVYERGTGTTKFAGDKPYTFVNRYDVTIIDKNPDSEIVERMSSHFPMCIYDRHFVSDNLNHDTFKLYY